MKDRGERYDYLQNNVYHLYTEVYSCLLRVNPWGLVEQLHFGAPVRTEDAESFACRPGLGWGSNVLLVEGDTASCADTMALEFSGSGNGKKSGDGQNSNAGNQNNAPAPAAPAEAPQESQQMPGNFTDYEGFGGGNNFFNL